MIIRLGNSQAKSFLKNFKKIAEYRILDHKQLQDGPNRNSSLEHNDNLRRSMLAEKDEGLLELAHGNNLKRRTNSKEIKILNENVQNVQRNDNKYQNTQSVYKMHVEKFQSVGKMFMFLQQSVQEEVLYEFFLNQYNVEHIYVDLMSKKE